MAGNGDGNRVRGHSGRACDVRDAVVLRGEVSLLSLLSLAQPRPWGTRGTTPSGGLTLASLPREARACLGRLLGAQVRFPNPGLRLQPAATGRLDGAPSGTRLGTQIPMEDSNCNRIKTLEGRRPRIESPVFLAEDRG